MPPDDAQTGASSDLARHARAAKDEDVIYQSKIKEHADVIAFTDVSLVAEWRMAHFSVGVQKSP